MLLIFICRHVRFLMSKLTEPYLRQYLRQYRLFGAIGYIKMLLMMLGIILQIEKRI
jgi:hypothetical protein